MCRSRGSSASSVCHRVDVPVPQIPFQTFQVPHNRITQGIVRLLILGLVRQAFSRLLEYGQSHRVMEPIEQVLRVRVQIELEIPHRCRR